MRSTDDIPFEIFLTRAEVSAIRIVAKAYKDSHIGIGADGNGQVFIVSGHFCIHLKDIVSKYRGVWSLDTITQGKLPPKNGSYYVFTDLLARITWDMVERIREGRATHIELESSRAPVNPELMYYFHILRPDIEHVVLEHRRENILIKRENNEYGFFAPLHISCYE